MRKWSGVTEKNSLILSGLTSKATNIYSIIDLTKYKFQQDYEAYKR